LGWILIVAPRGWAATEKVLYAFKDYADGKFPNGGLIDVKGRIYGTTYAGGACGKGTVYELTHTKAGWVKKTLHDFTGDIDGEEPWMGLVADKNGNLYGTADTGNLLYNWGVAYEMSRDEKGEWQFRVIHAFMWWDGSEPNGLIIDNAGNLYGTTTGGGAPCNHHQGCGTVFELSPSGNDWKLTTLFAFDGMDGFGPEWNLYRDGKDKFYSTTQGAGYGTVAGSVFELSRSGGSWGLRTLHKFSRGAVVLAGAAGTPDGPLIMDSAGAIYGTTPDGPEGEWGTVYKLTRGSSGEWRLSVLHTFGTYDAEAPSGGVVMDSKGNLYGPALAGGQFGWGAIFELKRTQKGWKESLVFSFNGQDGFGPEYGPIWGRNGELIGAATGGGDGYGVIYSLRP
jgi:uncharacterized repeat protein (TIGR03803 family)